MIMNKTNNADSDIVFFCAVHRLGGDETIHAMTSLLNYCLCKSTVAVVWHIEWEKCPRSARLCAFGARDCVCNVSHFSFSFQLTLSQIVCDRGNA